MSFVWQHLSCLGAGLAPNGQWRAGCVQEAGSAAALF